VKPYIKKTLTKSVNCVTDYTLRNLFLCLRYMLSNAIKTTDIIR